MPVADLVSFPGRPPGRMQGIMSHALHQMTQKNVVEMPNEGYQEPYQKYVPHDYATSAMVN